jgi:hypothetical protein
VLVMKQIEVIGCIASHFDMNLFECERVVVHNSSE